MNQLIKLKYILPTVLILINGNAGASSDASSFDPRKVNPTESDFKAAEEYFKSEVDKAVDNGGKVKSYLEGTTDEKEVREIIGIRKPLVIKVKKDEEVRVYFLHKGTIIEELRRLITFNCRFLTSDGLYVKESRPKLTEEWGDDGFYITDVTGTEVLPPALVEDITYVIKPLSDRLVRKNRRTGR